MILRLAVIGLGGQNSDKDEGDEDEINGCDNIVRDVGRGVPQYQAIISKMVGAPADELDI